MCNGLPGFGGDGSVVITLGVTLHSGGLELTEDWCYAGAVSLLPLSKPSTGLSNRRGTSVRCPVCDVNELELRTTCVSTLLWCTSCGRFELSRLFRLLATDDFETVAGLVEHRLSDRV